MYIFLSGCIFLVKISGRTKNVNKNKSDNDIPTLTTDYDN